MIPHPFLSPMYCANASHIPTTNAMWVIQALASHLAAVDVRDANDVRHRNVMNILADPDPNFRY
jgi:hypothetical protein